MISRTLCLLLVVFLQACATQVFTADPDGTRIVADRAQRYVQGPVSVATAVLGREETEMIFGIDLYADGIQPVWVEVSNAGERQIRFSPTSVDPDYFSPNEVAYKYRRRFSSDERARVAAYFDEMAMPRFVEPGQTRSGYVLTHVDRGSKGYNIDIFGSAAAYYFTFVVRVPGFDPDYANFDSERIYPDGLIEVSEEDLYDAIRDMACCSSNDDGSSGEPINLFLVSSEQELLGALLRSGWVETSREDADRARKAFLFDRRQDAIFRSYSAVGGGYFELRLWSTAHRIGDNTVWAGQVIHFGEVIESLYQFNPDTDSARNFAGQSFLYGQSLERIGWVEGETVAPVHEFWNPFQRPPFFSDGFRAVVWLSEPPGATGMQIIEWDPPPGSL